MKVEKIEVITVEDAKDSRYLEIWFTGKDALTGKDKMLHVKMPVEKRGWIAVE